MLLFTLSRIHDEMYSVQLDPSGNYLLLGGSGDEYAYSSCHDDGWCSDHWVSYLVVLNTAVSTQHTYVYNNPNNLIIQQGQVLDQGIYGEKGSNNAGEYLAVDESTGDLMVFVDSDALGGGFGFLKLSPT